MKQVFQCMAIAGLVMGVAGLLPGCGKAQEKVAEKIVEKAIEKEARAEGENVKVDIDASKGAVTIQSEDKTFQMKTGEGMKLPANFPKDVPVYSGLGIQACMSLAGEGAFTVQGTTSDDVDKVTAFYQKEAPAQGWKEEMSMKQADGQMLAYSKDDRLLNIVAGKSADKTSLTITTAKD